MKSWKKVKYLLIQILNLLVLCGTISRIQNWIIRLLLVENKKRNIQYLFLEAFYEALLKIILPLSVVIIQAYLL